MYFGSAAVTSGSKEFVDCFVEYEEREDEDGDSYTAAIPIHRSWHGLCNMKATAGSRNRGGAGRQMHREFIR